jgi:hypothetical protein
MLPTQLQTEIHNHILQMELACHQLVNFPESVHYNGGPLYTLFCELDALRETAGLPRRAVEAAALFGPRD